MAAAITCRVSGTDSVLSQLSKLEGNVAQANEAGVMAAGLVIQRGAAMRSPRKTGRNASSINTTLEGSGMSASAVVATGTDYGPFLELGTSKMAARPYMRPAAKEDAPQAEEAYRKIVEKALKV